MSAICAICHDELNKGFPMTVALKCGHIFHYSCIFTWFDGKGGQGKYRGRCPSCNHSNSRFEVLQVFVTTADEEADRNDDAEERKSVAELKTKLSDLESEMKKLKEQLSDSRWSYQEERRLSSALRKELSIEKSKFMDVTEKLGNLKLQNQGMGLALEFMKSKHGQLLSTFEKIEGEVNSVGGEWIDKDVGGGTALLKIANLVNYRNGTAAKMELNVVNEKTGDGVLAYAVTRRRPLTRLSHLVWHGGDFNHLNYNGESLLHIAASRGTPQALKFLLELRKLDVNLRNENGSTPLHLAILREKNEGALLEKCKLLIESRADHGILDMAGKSALILAANKYDKSVRMKLVTVMLGEQGSKEEGGANAAAKIQNMICSSQTNAELGRGRKKRGGRGRGISGDGHQFHQ